ncbi:MAG: ycjS 2 [Verrucomicrobiaceae bacterium]|nr:ycjS 2 [Verrucomicrobiaceae bacterium]
MNGIEWIVGPCTRVFCDAAHQALEGVTVGDTVTASARHGNVLVSYTMTQFQPPDEHTLLINGERGTVKIELHERRWGVMKHGEPGWTWHASPSVARDDLFISQAHSFLDLMEGKDSPPLHL